MAACLFDPKPRRDQSLLSMLRQRLFGILAGYEDCLTVLRNPALGRPEPDMDLPDGISGRERQVREDTSTMLMLNPPDHTRIRGLVSRE